MKKFTTLLALVLAFTFGTKCESAEYWTDLGGCGYRECTRCPSIATGVALGTLALVVIIAVALQNQSHGHGHFH